MADPHSVYELDPTRSPRAATPVADASSPQAFPRFAGQVFKRPPRYHQEVGARGVLDDYTAHAYQYATSSKPGQLQPAAVVYCANEEDIRLAIQYARDAGVAVAVRTGGHHFWGFSSTSGQNIQIDLSGFRHFDYDPATRTVTCGVGLKLEELDAKLGALGAFVPHGQCGAVRLGGHLQSGGFSVLCGRSFGWFSDHVVSFRIVTADLRTRVVTRPDPARPEPSNDELWFAAIGGSPGNFGVVTEMTLRPLWDEDHPESRTMTVYMHYTPEAHEALLQIVAEYNDDDELPADFNICTFILGAHPLRLRPNIDTRMMKERHELYGEGMEPHPTIIGLWATWCNLDGGGYTKAARAFFHELDRRTRPLLTKRDRIAAKLLGPIVGKVVPVRSPDEAVPMSVLTDAYCFPKRVHANPYVSATWCGQSQQTATNGFARWARDATAKVEAEPGCYPDFEWVVCGGRHSRNRTMAGHSAVAWRDVTMLCFQYVHFDHTDLLGRDWAAPRAFSEAWVHHTKRRAVGPDGILGPDDRRWNAFPEQDEDLDQEREHYFTSEEVYQRVLAVKREVDPHDVFTANRFCVGASRTYGTSRA